MAQPFSFGAKVGVPLTQFLSSTPDQAHPGLSYSTAINRYLAGATGEVHLPLGFVLEIDALYRHFGYYNGPYTADKASTGDLEFPCLAKYRFGGSRIRPFVDGGFAVDTLVGTTQSYFLVLIEVYLSNTLSDPNELHKRVVEGEVAGAGLDLNAGTVHFMPELRFTRWNDQHFSNPVPPLLSSNRNQVEFLLGITFH